MKTPLASVLVLGALLALAGPVGAQSVVTLGALGTPNTADNTWTNGPNGNLNTTASPVNFAFGGTYGPSGDLRPGLQMTAYSGQIAAVEYNNITTGVGNLSQFNGGNYTWSSQLPGDQISFKLSLFGITSGGPVFRGTLVYVPLLQPGGNNGVDTWFTDSFTQSSGLFFSTFPGAGGQGNLQTLASWISSPVLNAGLLGGTELGVFSVQLGVGSSGAHALFQATVNQLMLDVSGSNALGAGTQPYTLNFVPEPGTVLAGVFGLAAVGGLVVRRVRGRK